MISHIDVEYNCLKLGFPPRVKDAYMFGASVYDGGDIYYNLNHIEGYKLKL